MEFPKLKRHNSVAIVEEVYGKETYLVTPFFDDVIN